MRIGTYVVIPAVVLAAVGIFAVAPRWRARAAADDHSVAKHLDISGGEIVKVTPAEGTSRPVLPERTLPTALLQQITPNLPERPTMKLPSSPQRAERQPLVLPSSHVLTLPERTSIVSKGH